MKGRIIGRNGRNIRAFEVAAGVDVIVDDTPGVVIVSAFDNIRRETERIAEQAVEAQKSCLEPRLSGETSFGHGLGLVLMRKPWVSGPPE